jgi:TRAP-type mannitol/chloroaromatic compound transport system permease large subunit
LNWVISKITGFRILSHLAQQVTFVMVPPLALIFLVLGTIFIGVVDRSGTRGRTSDMLAISDELGATRERAVRTKKRP